MVVSIKNKEVAVGRASELLEKLTGHSYKVINSWLLSAIKELYDTDRMHTSGDYISTMGIKVTRYIYRDDGFALEDDYVEISLHILDVYQDIDNFGETYSLLWCGDLETKLQNID